MACVECKLEIFITNNKLRNTIFYKVLTCTYTLYMCCIVAAGEDKLLNVVPK